MTDKKLIGDRGEELISRYLLDKGYDILDRNYRMRFGEIDIIAQIDDIIVFVEVKTRKSIQFGSAASSVTNKKQQRLKKAASSYLLKNNLIDKIIRFDVAEVYTSTNEINYIENAIYYE